MVSVSLFELGFFLNRYSNLIWGVTLKTALCLTTFLTLAQGLKLTAGYQDFLVESRIHGFINYIKLSRSSKAAQPWTTSLSPPCLNVSTMFFIWTAVLVFTPGLTRWAPANRGGTGGNKWPGRSWQDKLVYFQLFCWNMNADLIWGLKSFTLNPPGWVADILLV